MFCPNCGIKMDDGTAFCGNCGFNVAESEGAGETALLTEPPVNFVRTNQSITFAENQPVSQAPRHTEQQKTQGVLTQDNPSQKDAPKKEKTKKQKQPKEKKKKKTGLIVALILVFLAIVMVFVAIVGLVIGSFFISPKATAEDFASKLSKQDTQGVYDLMFDENSVVTYEEFNDKYLNDDAFVLSAFAGNEDYEVVEISEDDTTSVFEVRYYNGNIMTLTIEKTKDGFLYFDEYSVFTDACSVYDVYIPDGALLYVNDIRIVDEPESDKVTGLNKYTISPVLTGEYNLKVQYMDATYEKLIYVLDDVYCNTITIDADDIEFGSTIKNADAYTTDDAEAFFGKVMDDYIFNSYRAVYYSTRDNIMSCGIESIALNGYRVYKGKDYNSEVEKVLDDANEGVLISDIMTEEEYTSLIVSDDGYKVYKLSEVQDRLNTLWGAGTISVSMLINEDDIITTKGFLLREGENDEKGIFDYYAKVKSSKFEASTNCVVIDAYVLKCDVKNKKIYDEGSGLQIASGQINRGAGVDFDAIVSSLKISTKKMEPIRFNFQLTDEGVVLLGATENEVSKDVLNAQNVVLQKYAQSFYMKVKADGGLNMRYEPTEKSQVLKLVPNNSAIEVRGYSSNIKDWVYVYWGGYEGWVNYKYLIPAEYTSQPSGEVYWYKVKADGGLNMRNAANQKGKLIKLIPDKSVVKFICYNVDATWAYVIYNDSYAGWVNTNYIKFDYSTDA